MHNGELPQLHTGQKDQCMERSLIAQFYASVTFTHTHLQGENSKIWSVTDVCIWYCLDMISPMCHLFIFFIILPSYDIRIRALLKCHQQIFRWLHVVWDTKKCDYHFHWCVTLTRQAFLWKDLLDTNMFLIFLQSIPRIFTKPYFMTPIRTNLNESACWQ